MNWIDFKKFIDSKLVREGRSLQLDYDFLSTLIKKGVDYDAAYSHIELGFESNRDFEILKLLFIELKLNNATKQFLETIIRQLNESYSIWGEKIRELIARLLRFRELLIRSSIHFSVEIHLAQIKKIKIYFSEPKNECIKKFVNVNSLLEELPPFFDFSFLKEVTTEFAVEYTDKLGPALKLYHEFYKDNPGALDLFTSLVKKINFENRVERFLPSLLPRLLKSKEVEKLGLRFKGEGLKKKEAKFYWGLRPYRLKKVPDFVFNLVKENLGWKREVDKLIVERGLYISYVCIGQDGLEVYCR